MKIYLVSASHTHYTKGNDEQSTFVNYTLFTSLIKARRYIHNYCTSANGNTSWVETPVLQRRVMPKKVLNFYNQDNKLAQNIPLATYKGVKEYKTKRIDMWFCLYQNNIK